VYALSIVSATATVIELTDAERATLESWVRAGCSQQRMVTRARIILMAADGADNPEISRALSIHKNTVSQWRVRFAKQRIDGLADAPRPGRPTIYDQDSDARILEMLDQPPPEGYACWNGSLLAEALDIPADQVWRAMRRHRISLQRRRNWCISNDPDFAAKAADIVGLYLDPPEGAVVLCVDEKPSIQALERAQGWLRRRGGGAITGRSHEYRRHGTTTLFAAFEVATGRVQGSHYRRRRRREFLDFMNSVVAEYGNDTELHVVLDNLNTHKPKHDRWLASHPNVHLHYTPTHASWLNQVEIWFSKLSRAALAGASFTSPKQVRDAIDAYIKVHNTKAQPFEWTKQDVRPSQPTEQLKDLLK